MAILSGVSDVKPETKEESTVATALVIRRGWVDGNSCFSRPVIVMAGESGVVFSRSDNMAVGLKFTAEEWNQIVEFVDSQLMQAFEDGLRVRYQQGGTVSHVTKQ